jgi:dATP pyrophosphohydrolase
LDVSEERTPVSRPAGKPYKLPVSVLVLVHTPALEVLLLERADRPGFWQSVTGSQTAGESLEETALRELFEETGLDAKHYGLSNWGKHNVFEIYPHWRHRYAPGVTHNTEHVFGVQVLEPLAITISPREHLAYAWLPWREAADKAFSWTNVQAILELPARLQEARPDTRGT